MLTSGVVPQFSSVEDVITSLSPDEPVHCVRPSHLHDAAGTFIAGFPGDTLYAVKCNANPYVLQHLFLAGITHFDVASDHEIKLISSRFPSATMYYHHPAKTAQSIKNAYHRYSVRYFAVDCEGELEKVVANTGPDAAITVRISVPQDNSVYDLSTKFGAPAVLARQLMSKAKNLNRDVGVTFHVGSQCLDPIAYKRAMLIAFQIASEAGVILSHMDVGGGFPGYYQSTSAPDWSVYFDTIRATAKDLFKATDTRLQCEPGRALVYGSSSLLTRVILRKENTLYINDGIFGGLAEIYWGGEALALKCRAYRDGRIHSGASHKYVVYGPTCDGNDKLPYLVNLPVDLEDGDWIEFEQLGAYGREMATRYNGLRSEIMVSLGNPTESLSNPTQIIDKADFHS